VFVVTGVIVGDYVGAVAMLIATIGGFLPVPVVAHLLYLNRTFLFRYER
jgi:hypothetical protein